MTAALLDMPGPEEHLKALANALMPDGVLGVFCPSVTQVGECLKVVRKSGLRLGRDMVVEFPPHAEGVGAGLRGWNVKYVFVRAKVKAKMEVEGGEVEGGEAVVVDTESEGGSAGEVDGEQIEAKELPAVEEVDEVLVCRPSVGERMVGGGFFGMFRKKGEC